MEMELTSRDLEEEPDRSALIGPARGCQRWREQSGSERCSLEKKGAGVMEVMEGMEEEGWEALGRRWVRRGRGHRAEEGVETAAAAAGPIG